MVLSEGEGFCMHVFSSLILYQGYLEKNSDMVNRSSKIFLPKSVISYDVTFRGNISELEFKSTGPSFDQNTRYDWSQLSTLYFH
jgi:hypothetical protein